MAFAAERMPWATERAPSLVAFSMERPTTIEAWELTLTKNLKHKIGSQREEGLTNLNLLKKLALARSRLALSRARRTSSTSPGLC